MSILGRGLVLHGASLGAVKLFQNDHRHNDRRHTGLRRSEVPKKRRKGQVNSAAQYVDKGVPVLEYLENKLGENPTVLNNLGQAWYNVGDISTSKKYLHRVLAVAPGHGHANATEGLIDQHEGNTTQALQELKTAAEAVSSVAAREELQRQKQTYNAPNGFLRFMRRTEYFSASHYDLPDAQGSLEEASKKQAELSQFLAKMTSQNEAASNGAADAAKNMGAELFKMMQSGGGALPYGALDVTLYKKATDEFGELLVKVAKRRDEVQKEIGAIRLKAQTQCAAVDDAFETQWGKEFDEGATHTKEALDAQRNLCKQKQAFIQEALSGESKLYSEFGDSFGRRLRRQADDLTNYPFLFEPAPMARAHYFSFISSFLLNYTQIGGTMPIEYSPCDSRDHSQKDGKDDTPPPDNCPIHLNLNIKVVKLKATCTTLGFEFEAGLDFKATKDFKSGETTLTAGLGADVGAASFNGGFEFTWNRDNQLSYVGMQTGASASIDNIHGLTGAVESTLEGTDAGKGHDLVDISTSSSIGVTLGPGGPESTMSGESAANVMGRDLFNAKL